MERRKRRKKRAILLQELSLGDLIALRSDLGEMCERYRRMDDPTSQGHAEQAYDRANLLLREITKRVKSIRWK